MKKICTILAVVACLLFALLACNSSSAPEAIYFDKSNMPRQTYVQGQELDLSAIVLTCQMKDGTTTVTADSADVTVSGYDKNVLGEQTVVVTYMEKTTNFKVTVIPRIAVEGYDANYFVGDPFNKNNGRLKIADDQGKITTVNMKEDAVVISGFDSSTAGQKTLTVTCNGYTGTFTVNVLGFESVKFNSPSKKAYQSHETDFSVSGGYFTVTAEGGAMQKTVPLTVDMVKGFDPSVATMENKTPTTAAKQTVTIEYLGYTFQMEISIRYSGVSIFQQRAEEMMDVNCDEKIPASIGENAIEAMNEFFELSRAEQSLLTNKEVNTVARIASIYAYEAFVEEAAKYSHTFTLEPGESTTPQGAHKEYCGYFTIACEKYEDMVAALEVLDDENSTFNVLADFLHKMEEEFKTLEIKTDVKIDKYFEALFLKDDLPFVADLFGQMVKIFEEVSVVPDEWDRDIIKDAAMAEGIEGAYSRIITSNFSYRTYPQFYAMISAWREKNDLFEIIHTHYLYNKTYSSDKENYSSTVWEKIPFPGELQDLYNCIANGFNQSASLQSGVYDTTYFMLAYYDALNLKDSILANENKLYADIYTAIDFDNLINGYLYTDSISGQYSYVEVVGSLLYRKEILDLIWNDFFAIVELTDEDGVIRFDDPKTAPAIEKLFNDFFSLSDFDRYLIICSMYSNYRGANIEGHAFDYSKGTTGLFISIFAYYYTGDEGVLPESTHELFQKLMIATEQYTIRYKHLSKAAGAVEEYIKMMDEVIEMYNALSSSDRALFDQYAGAAYRQNLATYNSVKKEAPSIDTYPVLEEFKAVLESYYAIQEFISNNKDTASESGAYALLFMTYEKARALENAILSSGNAELIEMYRAFNYMVLNANDESENNDYSLTLEAMFELVQSASYGFSITITNNDESKTSYNAVDYYTKAGIAPFMADAYKVLYTHFNGGTNTREAVLALMEAFRALDTNARGMFYSLNLDACYYAAIEAFFQTELADDANAAALATALIEAEKAYATYLFDTEDAEDLAAFNSAWEAVVAAKTALGEGSDDYEALLKVMYEYYLEAYNGVSAAE